MWCTLYNILLTPAWALLSLVRPFRSSGFRERMGDVDTRVSSGGFWIHCASVGELSAIQGIVAEMKADRPGRQVVISTMTATGKARAEELFPGVYSFVAPLDFPFSVRKTLKRIAPSVLFIAETELWPNLISMSAKRGVTVVVLNGRLSGGSLRVYLLFRPFFSRVLKGVRRFFVQTESDSAAYQKLGVDQDRISVTGTMKSDVKVRSVDRGSLMSDYGIPEEAWILVAGSVRPEEEKAVLEAIVSVAETVPSAYFIVAPRHLQRASGIAALADELGLQVRLRSSGAAYSGEKLLILDTMGELSTVYGLSHVSFVGGSLKPYGGHNVLEPAMWSVPVLFGKYTSNCNEEAEELVSSEGGMRVEDSADLASAALLLLTDHPLRETMGRNACKVVERRAGVSKRVYEELRSFGLLNEDSSE